MIQNNHIWPLGLLLDEVWLKVHRVIIHQLQVTDYWIQDEEYAEFMDQQRIKGENLKKRLILPLMGEDYFLLETESVFGPMNKRFRSKLPISLSFGYDIGLHFSYLSSGQTDWAEKIASLSALFNTGISIFDLILDHYPHLSKQLIEIINEKTLSDLATYTPTQLAEFYSVVLNVEKPELKILLKFIIGFFIELNKLFPENNKIKARQELLLMLIKGLKSELLSVNYGTLPIAEQLKIARLKSVLPFLIIKKLATIPVTDNNKKLSKTLNTFITCFAESFWLLDDFVDLVRDLQNKSINNVLLQIQKNILVEEDYPVLQEILKGNYIVDTSQRLIHRINICNNFLKQQELDSNISNYFILFFLAYIRDWMS
ncbi:hypothetical protein Q0590_00070 [Rhodocytophaga aerolata]|uniref:Uncharacterized protein n=1 Tax=Rhodocytophaga aerolata TaxID=455078 RepID=A0ABT8QY77_9BACT|nr:hypothetical protein [Rhodocytophaga aerolata]MDO1444619.1 hypothetical protein [Rhodocytophaga aerolata]